MADQPHLVWRRVPIGRLADALASPGCVADEARIHPDGRWALVRFTASPSRASDGAEWFDRASARVRARQWNQR